MLSNKANGNLQMQETMVLVPLSDTQSAESRKSQEHRRSRLTAGRKPRINERRLRK